MSQSSCLCLYVIYIFLDEPALKKPKLEVEESGESAMADMLMSEEFLSVEIKEEEDDDDEEEEEDVRRPFKKGSYLIPNDKLFDRESMKARYLTWTSDRIII